MPVPSGLHFIGLLAISSAEVNVPVHLGVSVCTDSLLSDSDCFDGRGETLA